MERIDLYKDQYIDTHDSIIRGDSIPSNKYALIVFVCIFNYEGKMLIQRRQFSKKGWPGMWDVSAGGAVLSGEQSSDAAHRETLEELGINLKKDNFQKIVSIYYDQTIHDIYTIEADFNIQDIHLQEEEVLDVKFADYTEICQMIEEGHFIPVYKEFIALLFKMRKEKGILKHV